MALEGCVFFIAGKAKTSKENLEKQIKEHGGTISKLFYNKVTHFLCLNGGSESPKYKTAIEKGVKIVEEEFIRACIIAESKGKLRPNEDDFKPLERNSDEENEATTTKGDHQAVEESKSGKEDSDEDEVDASQSQKGNESQKETSNGKKKKRKSVKGSKPPVEQISAALSGWVVALAGHSTKPHAELTQYIESHGGKVVSTISAKVTHLVSPDDINSSQSTRVEAAKDAGIIIIDEDYLEWFVKDKIEKENQPVPSPEKTKKKNKKRTIDKIISRRLVKGEPHYLVSYVGLSDSTNDLIPREQVEQGFGTKKLKLFDRDYENQLKEVFSVDSLFLHETASPVKQRKPKSKTGKENQSKSKSKNNSSQITEKNNRVSLKRTKQKPKQSQKRPASPAKGSPKKRAKTK